jgi:thiol-disulfide isomerase/thioredoxin
MKRLSRLGILPGILCLIGCALTVLVVFPDIVWKPRAVHQDPDLPVTAGIDLDGRPLALTEYHGKVVLVVFWATWCGPCMAAIPHELELYRKFDPSSFQILGINADSDLDRARTTEKEHEIPWRSLQYKTPALKGSSTIADCWGIRVFPTFVLMDREGNVVRKINSLRNIERFVQQEVEKQRPIDEHLENNRRDTDQ